MSKFKGTPGKFKHEVIEACDGNVFISVLDEEGTSIAFCGKDSLAEANARLFSASPDLLEVLQRLDAQLRKAWDEGRLPWDVIDTETTRATKSVIAKALGTDQ